MHEINTDRKSGFIENLLYVINDNGQPVHFIISLNIIDGIKFSLHSLKKYEDNFRTVDNFSKLLISLYNDPNFCSGLNSSIVPIYESMDILNILSKSADCGLISCIFLQYLKREENVIQKLIEIAWETDAVSKQIYDVKLRNERKPNMKEG